MRRKLIVAMLTLTLLLSLAACNPRATGLEITTEPTKSIYILGEDLDLTGGKFKVKYSNNTLGDETLMTDEDVSHNFNKNALGSQTVTITYLKAKGTITVTVVDAATALKTYLAAFPTFDFEVKRAVWTVGQTTTVTDAWTLLSSMSEAQKAELEVADIHKVIKTVAYMYRTEFYDLTDKAKTEKQLIGDYDDLIEFLEYYDTEFTEGAESIFELIGKLDDTVVLYTDAGQDITSTKLAGLLQDEADAVASEQKTVATLLDGVYGIEKSGIVAAGAKINASFELFEDLYDEGGSVFAYVQTTIKACFPAYFDIICEYFYLLDNSVTEKVEFIFNNFIDPQIVDKADNVGVIAETLWDMDADGDVELFILNYVQYLALLDDLTDYGYDFIWGFADKEDETLTAIYNEYCFFDGLDEPVFYELYIKYLELKKADTGTGFYETPAFKPLAESMLDAYYGVDFDRQWLLRQNATRFKAYFNAYIERFVENYTNELSFQDFALAREALENARVSPVDKHDNDSLLSFYNALTNAENWYLNVKYQYNESIHPYMELEYESLIADYMYKIGQILEVYEEWDNNFYIWDYYMGRLGFPSDMVYYYAYAMGLESIFSDEYSNNAAIMAKYDEYLATPMQTMAEVTDEYYQTIADRYGADMYESSILFWERIQKVFNKRSRDSLAYFEFWQELGPEVAPFIEEWWQMMFIDDEEYVALGIGFAYAANSGFSSTISEYLEYYVFADYFDFSKYGDNCPLMKLYYNFIDPMGTMTWGTSPDDEYVLTQMYSAMKNFEKLREDEQELYNFLPDGGFNGFLQSLFDEYRPHDEYVYEIGWQLARLNVDYLSTRTNGNKYVFVSSFIEFMDKYNKLTEEQRDLINQIYGDDDGESVIASWNEIYQRYMYPYAVADDGLGITQQDVEDFLSTFKVMAGLMEDYGAEIKEVLDAQNRGEEVDPDTWDRIKDVANEFFDILNSVPNRMKEALVASALDNDTLFGDLSYHFMNFIAQDLKDSENIYELAKTLINVNSNYLAYTAELERIEAIGGDPLSNFYLYRFLEVFKSNNITDKFNNLTDEEKEEFMKSELFFDLYSDLIDKFNELQDHPTPLFERLVEEYRIFNTAWAHFYGAFQPWDSEYQAEYVGDLAYFYAAYEIFEEFMTYFHENATEFDEAMFTDVVIMINIGIAPNTFYESYYKSTGLFIYAANAADMYQNLFLDILHPEVAGHAEEILPQDCDELIDSLVGIAKAIITDGELQYLYDLDEQIILDFMSKFSTFDDETAFWFLVYFPSYYGFILDYYLQILPVRDMRIMQTIFETEYSVLTYKYWYNVWQESLVDPEIEDWESRNLYDNKVAPAQGQVWLWSTRAYNLYGKLEEPTDLIESLFNLIVLPEFGCVESDCEFNETLHNIGSLLMAANSMYYDWHHVDFNIVYNLLVIAIDGLNASDLAVFNTAIYYEHEEDDESVTSLTLKDMYEEIQRLNIERIENLVGSWLSEEEREEALHFYGIYQEAAWQWWLDDFSDWSYEQLIDGARDVLEALCDYVALCSDAYTIRNDIANYCNDMMIIEMFYNIILNDFDSDSVAFALAYQMLYAYNDLLSWDEASFVYKMNDCLAMYYTAGTADITEFRATFGSLFDQLETLWDMVYRWYI